MRMAMIMASAMQVIRTSVVHLKSKENGSDAWQTKGFLSHRVADRRGDHFDHRGHRHPEPPPVTYGRERVFGGGFYPHHQHSGSHFCVHLSKRWFRGSDRFG